MKVLYIHLTGAFGGSSRSLCEAVRNLPEDVEPHFLTQRGTVEQYFSTLGKVMPVRGLSQFDNTEYSHYRGLRWLVALREIAFLPATFRAIRVARRAWPEIDLIHLNEFTGLLPMLLAKKGYGVPVVVHVRSVSRIDRKALSSRLVEKLLRRHASAVVAIDETVRHSLPSDLPVEVIHNGFTPRQVREPEANLMKTVGELRPGALRIGFIGNLLKVKGIEDLVEAARIVKGSTANIEYVIIGDDARSSRSLRARILQALGLNQNVKQRVETMIADYGLSQDFHMAGFVSDIAQAYRHIDVLCFPSHFDAPGRPVFEAAFFGVPSIVAVTKPTADTLVPGETGLAIRPKRPEELAHAILACAADLDNVRRMGAAAKAMAESNFNPATNARKLYNIYQRVLGRSGSR
jgi:glycosyltransferase involved in cell wall biosynthesis